MSASITIRVRDGNGAYTTNQVQGKRASCTHSATEAALSLARKLAPDAVRHLRHIGHSGNVDTFELEISGDAE